MNKELKNSINDLIDYAHGNKSNVDIEKENVLYVPKFTSKNIKNIRKKMSKVNGFRITQKRLAAILAVSQRTVESWEAGRSYPNGSSARLLQYIEKNPKILNQSNYKPSRLLILGNGFDLHCGLHTEYSTFIKHLAKTYSHYDNELNQVSIITGNYLNDFYQTMELIDKNKNSYISSKNTFVNSHYLTNMFRNSFEYNSQLQSDTKCNFWFIYFCLLNKLNACFKSNYILKFKDTKALTNWCDVEGQIESFFDNYSNILTKYIYTIRRFYNENKYIFNSIKLGHKQNKILFSLHNQIYQIYVNDVKKRPNYTNAFMPAYIMNLLENSGFNPLSKKRCKNNLYQFLYDQLRKLEYCFKIFITTINKGKNKHTQYIKLKNEAIKAMTDDNKYTLLTFNYTNNTTNKCSAYKNVHSTIHKLPIFGIDTTNNADKPYYKFTKTYRIMRLANGSNQPDSKKVFDLANGPKYIIFYGQSLAHADYSYFVAIFNHFQIYKMSSNVNLIFYYTNFDGEEEGRQFSRIYKLMSHYGKKTHHPDLLHKMLLEDRLTIKELKD